MLPTLMLVRDCIIITDRDLDISSINPAGQRFFGLANDAIGVNWRDLINHRLVACRIPLHDPARLTDGAKQAEGDAVLDMDNGARHVHYTVAVNESPDEGYIIIIEDKTNQFAEEEKIKHIADKLAELENIHNESELFRNKVLAIISHDLRSPLTSYIGLLNLLLNSAKDPLSERQTNIIKTMRRSAMGQLNLMENLISLAKIKRNTLIINLAPVPTAEIMTASVNMLRQMAQERGVDIVFNPDSDSIINVDREKTLHVINNLVANSIKFSEPGSIITLSTETNGDNISIVVKDTGPGMAPEKLATVFEMTDKPGDGEDKGAGLGLIICRELTRLNGGAISLESFPEQGVTARVTFRIFKKV